MAINVGGIYVDKSYNITRKIVSLSKLNTLPTTRCAAIILFNDTPRDSKNDYRVWPLYGKDYIAVKVEGDRIYVDEWDDEDESVIIKSIEKPFDNYERVPRPQRVDSSWTTFIGVMMPDAKWKEAQEIIGEYKW